MIGFSAVVVCCTCDQYRLSSDLGEALWVEDGLDGAKVSMMIGYLNTTPRIGDFSNVVTDLSSCGTYGRHRDGLIVWTRFLHAYTASVFICRCQGHLFRLFNDTVLSLSSFSRKHCISTLTLCLTVTQDRTFLRRPSSSFLPPTGASRSLCVFAPGTTIQ